MTNDQLIEQARNHAKNIAKDSGQPWATSELLNEVTVAEAVVVTFRSQEASRPNSDGFR